MVIVVQIQSVMATNVVFLIFSPADVMSVNVRDPVVFKEFGLVIALGGIVTLIPSVHRRRVPHTALAVTAD